MGPSRTRVWLRLIAGVATIILGIVAFAWPQATLRVVAFVFGINLLILGAFRIMQMLVTTGVPALHRVLGILFGLIAFVAGVLCLANVATSLSLLLLIVAFGWIVDGLGEIFLTIGRGEPGGGWRIAVGVLIVLASIAVLVWPGLGLATFVLIGATTLVFAGICLVLAAIAGLRTAHP
ncbi:hypothetical protein MB27_34925 [Actinoplanes utahensis]|uniref:Acid-resistance membrane protein n=1 Tax=Actinoplanes utahensis TaxID=1869 RepID=A0A0A6X0D8_ACTUT|nr:hypothetical protein MB27_34925 [Actinoplanes utahensis]